MTSQSTAPGICALATDFAVPPTTDAGAFTDKLTQLLLTSARCPGFWSGEILPPRQPGAIAPWRLVARFSSESDATEWQFSEARRQLLSDMTVNLDVKTTEEVSGSHDSDVATAIVTEIRPGKEAEFFAWQTKIQAAQARRPGYRGVYLQPPAPGMGTRWAAMVRFNTPEALEGWFECDERKALLAEAGDTIMSTKLQRVPTSFPGWFPVDELTGKPPAKWKTGLLVLLGIFPLMMLQSKYITPLLIEVPPTLRSSISLLASVVCTTYVTTPALVRLFNWWLLPSNQNSARTNALGVALALLVFLLEIVLLWDILPRRPHP